MVLHPNKPNPDDDGVFWMTAKRDGECTECETEISTDDRIVWDSREFKVYCSVCGTDLIGEDSIA